METLQEKVYVAIGADLLDGFRALQWALRMWSSQSKTIVILHATNNICKDYVYTPFGKLPASSLSEEKMKALEISEKLKNEKLLSKYVTYCGKVKAETLEIGRDDKPFHELVLELISSLQITKLVMAFTFMKSSSWKSRSAISGSFYIHRHKPESCELFIICGGKLVFLKGEGENDGFVEDDQGITVGKLREKNSFKGWLGKMLPANERSPCSSPSSSSSTSNDSFNRSRKQNIEIDRYFNQLLSSNAENEDHEVENDIHTESDMADDKSAAERIEALEKTIQLSRKEAKDNKGRQRRAEWAINLSTARVEELEAHTKNEVATRVGLTKELDSQKEEFTELKNEVEEIRSKLNSLLRLQHELSNKLNSSSLAKTGAEIQLEMAVKTRMEMVHENEEVRRQRDVLQRRIEFCKEKDAIGKDFSTKKTSFDNRMFTASEIRAATHDFSDGSRLKSGGQWTNVYKGRIDHITVAIKLYNADKALSQEAFEAKVKLLSNIRHPHLLGIIGICSELSCIVFEYMHNGFLRDTLFSTTKSSGKKNRSPSWHVRTGIAAEICSGLAFLHRVQPRPIVHGNLNPSKILLDRHNVAKIYGYKAPSSGDESDTTSDIHAFGNLILQLLTGRNWATLDKEAIKIDAAAIILYLDEEWPPNLAIQLCSVAITCLSTTLCLKKGLGLNMNMVMGDVVKVKEIADELARKGNHAMAIEEGDYMEDSSNYPSVFLCPIYQDVMKNPQVAADGFSYELEAIEEWLATGHDTSPMTNLKLKNKILTPNQTLRSLIEEWHTKRSIPFG